MSRILLHHSQPETNNERFRQALERVRPRLRCLLIALPVIAAAFVAPAILLCKIVGQQVIIWAIVATLGFCATALYGAARRLEKQDVSNPRAGDYLMAAVLTLAAGILLAALALEDGPWQERSLPIMTAAALLISMAALGTSLLISRARRILAAQRLEPEQPAQSP